MTFHAVPGAALVEVRWQLESQKCENRFYCDTLDRATLTQLQEITDVVVPWVTDTYKALVSAAVTFTEVIVTDAESSVGNQISTPINLPGNRTGALLPNEMSYCVSLRTGLRGRSGRGRWYMPPPLEADRDGVNAVNTTYIAGATGAMVTLINALFTAGLRMCVVQNFFDNARITPPVKHHYTTAIAVDNLLDSQRRRKPGNGT